MIYKLSAGYNLWFLSACDFVLHVLTIVLGGFYLWWCQHEVIIKNPLLKFSFPHPPSPPTGPKLDRQIIIKLIRQEEWGPSNRGLQTKQSFIRRPHRDYKVSSPRMGCMEKGWITSVCLDGIRVIAIERVKLSIPVILRRKQSIHHSLGPINNKRTLPTNSIKSRATQSSGSQSYKVRKNSWYRW